MKSIIAIATLAASTAFAATTQVSVNYEVFTGQAQCREVNCSEEACNYRIYFNEESFAAIRAKGFEQTRFAESPNLICQAGKLPVANAINNTYAPIKVLLYTADLNALNHLLK